ncbi:MAG: hypothetical protein H0W99_02390 [Acidobacteria bacterium]|nr:hypothetical protein [Acidobacteriota bacterium]
MNKKHSRNWSIPFIPHPFVPPSSLIPHPFVVALAPHLRAANVASRRQRVDLTRTFKIPLEISHGICKKGASGEQIECC